MVSSGSKHVQNILKQYEQLVSDGIEPYAAIKQVLRHTVKKAYVLNILEEQYGVQWNMKSRFLSMKKDFRNAFLVDYFTDNLHPCPVCGEPTPHISVNCCKECSARNIVSIKKRTIKTAETKHNKPHKTKETYFQKHGEKYKPTKEHKEKIKQAMLKKYGVSCIFKVPEIRNKAKQNCLKKFDSPSPFGSKEVFAKARQTCKTRFGTEYYSQSDISKAKHSEYVYKRQEHIWHFENYNEDFIRRTFIRGGVYYITEVMDYFNISYTGAINQKHNFAITEPNNINHNTLAEKELVEFISQYTQVICHDRKILFPKELDIVIPKCKLAIEYNGLYWHSEEQGKDRFYHVNKTMLCEQHGYQLFHIFEGEDLDIWKSMIAGKIGLNKRIYARQTKVKSLAYTEVKDFISQNHIQGDCSSSINYGLFYNNELVQVMTFAKPRFDTNYDYELIRLCSKKFTSVVGGASKLFKHFVMQHSGANIISYANRRFSMGRIYKILGFELKEITKPNYFYSKHGEVYSHYQTQKHKLLELLGDGYDKKLTERENMLNNKFLVVYDCGNLVYTYKGK